MAGLDLFERVVILCLFVRLFVIVFEELVDEISPIFVALLLVELLMVVFVVFRRPAEALSTHPNDWAVAWLATCSPMLVMPSDAAPVAPELLCTSLVVLGMILQVSGKLVLNRRFGVVPANRGVRASGPYGLIRHPIYLGYALSHVGVVFFAPSAWNLAVYAFAFVLQINRIFREERVLLADSAYRAYSASVRFRLVPGVF